MTQPYETINYYALALDPIHVGTGGYRLCRVDLSIVREPGTNVPKIPGTSLSGVTRAYAAMATGRYNWTIQRQRPDGTTITVPGSCAGQGQAGEQIVGHCGSPYCPVCVAFGFARGDSGGFQGLAQFADARVLFFPVHSLIGPVWITSPAVLAEHGVQATVSPDKVKLVNGLETSNNRLNLGWLMLQCDEGTFAFQSNQLPSVPGQIKQRTVLVCEKLFGQIISDNLEVRTSVSIDPATGAAEEGALFTYEALPRGTVLWFPITYSKPEFFRIQHNGRLTTPDPRQEASTNGQRLSVRQVVESGLVALEHLGIGGMNTRGMGRLKVLGLNVNSASSSQSQPSVSQAGGRA
jgi:CRISPR-associated protein Cmr4